MSIGRTPHALIWAVMLAGAAALRRGEHMQIGIVIDALPRALARIVDIARRIVIVAVLGFMTVMGAYYAQKIRGMSPPALNIPRTIPTASGPVGMGLMLLPYLLLQIAGPALPRRERAPGSPGPCSPPSRGATALPSRIRRRWARS